MKLQGDPVVEEVDEVELLPLAQAKDQSQAAKSLGGNLNLL